MRYIRPINSLDFFKNDLDDFFNFGNTSNMVMKTDVREKDGNYILDIEIPGYNKDEINIDYEDGYLIVSVKKENIKEEKQNDNSERYIRRERFVGSSSRKFYIGEINEDDIKAGYENGILTLSYPKESKKIENKKHISIN